MSYQRVIPRDLFNESKLLKCIGQLCLKIHDKKLFNIDFYHDDSDTEYFKIELNENLSALYISNTEFTNDEGRLYHFYSTYNSKKSYPLFLYDYEEEVEIEVFDEEGNCTEEFLEFLNN